MAPDRPSVGYDAHTQAAADDETWSDGMDENWNPIADPNAIVVAPGGKARFTILTDRMIRMEWSPVGRFEDRASQVFVNRRTSVPKFGVMRTGRNIEIDTGAIRLFFSHDGKAFHPGNLKIVLDAGDGEIVWTPGTPELGNLGGTTRTLDMVNGSCPLEPGLISRDGWVVVDDSRRLVFERRPGETERAWLIPRRTPGATDWYFFGYGREYARALRDYSLVAGRIPLPPRYVFGVWWSRYWAYTDAELRDLVGQFRQHDVPIDVLVVDMDWHKEGWTGYSWSDQHFPDPEGFLAWSRSEGLKVTLNLHPADGVGRHEDSFAPMARAMGLDRRRAARVPFDCTDPVFVEAYFRYLHWPLEKQGIDFWWMDWQQGTRTNVAGLDPLWWLNHLHWDDMHRRRERDPAGVRKGKRPLVFSRWGGLGNHRYPIGFSGDTFSTWTSLAWQSPFTATAANVGYAYWSHDIGGHQPGPVDPELYVRWIQYGALSPVLRTHTSKNPLGERRIWAYPDREFRAMREAFRLRYRLVPYLYTAARRCFDEAAALCRPLYHLWPKLNEAYEQPGEYMLGDDLLVAPVSLPGDKTSRCASVKIWLPPGRWTEWYTGRTRVGPLEFGMLVPLEETPIFVREGGIIPTAPVSRSTSEQPLDHVTLLVFPGDSGSTRLYEDDGEGHAYATGECAWTPISFNRNGRVIAIDIGAAEGSFEGMIERRSWEVRLCDRWPAAGVSVDGNPISSTEPGAESGWWYDEAKLTIVIRLPATSVRTTRRIAVTLDAADDAQLRAGLHSQLKLFDAVKDLLGPTMESGLPDAGAIRKRAIASRGNDLPEITKEGRWALARRIAEGGPLEAGRAEAVCRLLGLSCSIQIRSDERAGRVRTTTTGSLNDREAADGPVDVVQRPSRPWKEAPAARVCEGDPSARTLIQCWETEMPLQQVSLRATVTVSGPGGETIDVPFEETVLPSINGWWVIGPFEGTPDASLDPVYGPEQSLDLASEYRGKAGFPVRWKRVERTIQFGDDPTCEFFVDLHKAFGSHTDDAIAYAVTYINCDADTEAVLAIGSDDGVAVWVNGTEVHRNHVQRGYGSKQDWVRISLRRGRNTMLLKIAQAKGAWGFGVHLENVAGGPLKGATISLDR